MVQIPVLVKDAPIVRMTNSVLVGTMKFTLDVRENMVSEWSKMQQLCEEASVSMAVEMDMATLGLTDVMARLTEIATLLRDKLTER